jgi:hypothetical protein
MRILVSALAAGALLATAVAVSAADDQLPGEPRVEQHSSRDNPYAGGIDIKAPGTQVEVNGGNIRVQAPYTLVERTNDHIRIRAPFFSFDWSWKR